MTKTDILTVIDRVLTETMHRTMAVKVERLLDSAAPAFTAGLTQCREYHFEDDRCYGGAPKLELAGLSNEHHGTAKDAEAAEYSHTQGICSYTSSSSTTRHHCLVCGEPNLEGGNARGPAGFGGGLEERDPF